MWRYLVWLPLLALPGFSVNQPKPIVNNSPLSALDVVGLALRDSRTIPPYDRNFIRYLWVTDGDFKASNTTLNVISRASTVVRSFPLYGGVLLRVDARLYTRFFPNSEKGKNSDIEEFLKNWEQLKYDPALNLLITKDNIKLAQGQFNIVFPTKKVEREVEKTIDCAPYFQEGKWWNQEVIKVKETVEEPSEFQVLRFNPDYLSPYLDELQKLLYTEAPLVSDNYFMARVLHTVKNRDKIVTNGKAEFKDSVFTVIWGGLYYEFRGIKRSSNKNITDEDLFLDLFGVADIDRLFEELQSDQRAALFKSGVTGKPRRVDFFNTPSGRAWDTIGIGSITHDLLDKDIDVATHPIMNLLNFKDSAREAIFVGPNGMHVYAIFDGKGKLLDEADINAVTDRTVPSPHSPKLQCAMSCIACHEAEGSGGWKDVGNDVKLMFNDRNNIGSPFRLDIVADLSVKDQVGAINRLASLYQGDFSKGMRRGRDDYAEVILRTSGPQGEDQTAIVKTAMNGVVTKTRFYLYGPDGNGVSPQQALFELGISPGEVPLYLLRDYLSPESSKLGFSPEDPRIAALKNGISIPRSDWSFVRSFAASRVYKRQQQQQKQGSR